MFGRCLLFLAVLPILVASAASAYTPTDAERYAQRDLNNTRVYYGRHSLRMATTTSWCAHQHSLRMARSRRLFHSSCANARENVGYATTIPRVLDLWLRSSSHRPNALCWCSRVAIGIVRSGGYYWVTEIYW